MMHRHDHGLGAGPTLVTGAAGFIGSALVPRLAARVSSVHALLGPPGTTDPNQQVTVGPICADIEDRVMLESLIRDAEVVYHLAGLASVADSFRRPDEHLRVHAGGTRALIEACQGTAVRRLVYVSSAEVYGESNRGRVAERHPLAPRSPYGTAKLAAEFALREWSEHCGVEVVVLRLFSVFGPRPTTTTQSVIDELIQQACMSDAIRPFHLAPVRDYCHVDDVVSALIAAGSAALTAPFQILNIGTGQGTSVAELAATIRRIAGRDIPVLERDGTDRPRRSDILHLVADPRRAGSALGWRAQVGIAEGLRGMMHGIVAQTHA